VPTVRPTRQQSAGQHHHSPGPALHVHASKGGNESVSGPPPAPPSQQRWSADRRRRGGPATATWDDAGGGAGGSARAIGSAAAAAAAGKPGRGCHGTPMAPGQTGRSGAELSEKVRGSRADPVGVKRRARTHGRRLAASKRTSKAKTATATAGTSLRVPERADAGRRRWRAEQTADGRQLRSTKVGRTPRGAARANNQTWRAPPPLRPQPAPPDAVATAGNGALRRTSGWVLGLCGGRGGRGGGG